MDNFTVEPLQTSPLRLKQFPLLLRVIALVVVIALTGGALLWFFGRSNFSESKVGFTVAAKSSDVAAGDIATFTVTYENRNATALTNTRLVFVYPPDAIALHQGARADARQETVNLDRIEAGAGGNATFTAIIVGHRGDIKTAHATLDFVPEGLTTELETSADSVLTIASTPVALAVVAPPNVSSGQAIAYLIDYRNQTAETLRNLRLRVRLPEGFTTTQKRQEVWEIPMLETGGGGRITIEGTIQGREKEVKTISVVLEKEVVTSTSRFPIDIETASAGSVISAPLLSAMLAVNNATDYIAHVGDKLSYTFTVTNNTDSDLTSITATAKLEGAMYDFGTVDSAGSFDSRTGTLLWNSAVVPQLGRLRPRSSVAIPFRVVLKSAFPGSLNTKDVFIKVSARAETFNVPDVVHLESLSASSELITRITTNPTFAQELVAPVVPRVDQSATYTVRWTIVNPSTEIAPAKVTAVLLPGVSWQGNTQTLQAQPSFDPKTSVVTWNIGNVPPGVGVQFPAYELKFQVSLTPSVNQVGQSLIVLKDTRFEGIDTLTKQVITLQEQQLIVPESVQP